MKLSADDRILLLGESKSGKSYLAQILAKQYKRVLVISPYPDEWTDMPKENVTYTLNPQECFKAMKKALATKNVLLVVDDADLFLEPYILEDDSIKVIVIGGRHFGIAWMMVSRRTQDMPKLILKQANKVVCFQTDNARDLDIIEDNYGKEAALIVKDLNRKTHEFLLIDREERTLEVLIA